MDSIYNRARDPVIRNKGVIHKYVVPPGDAENYKQIELFREEEREAKELEDLRVKTKREQMGDFED